LICTQKFGKLVRKRKGREAPAAPLSHRIGGSIRSHVLATACWDLHSDAISIY
jgi:hypothetical protein